MKFKLLILFVSASIIFYSCDVEHPVEPEYFIENFNYQTGTTSQAGLTDSLIFGGINYALQSGFINSVIIIKNNKLITENYFNGTSQSTVFDVKSVTKSYVSTFAGIAIDKGLLSLDAKMIDYFPELKDHLPDQRIKNITIRHLLTMTSGLKSDALVFPDIAINDWTSQILSFPLDNEPGTFYRYSDSGAYLLSAVITKATGQNTFEFAKNNFFNPLNYALQGWTKTTAGVPIGGSTMMFTPRNMAVLGLLFLNKGKLNGRQIVSENWINAATVDQVNWQNEEWGPVKKLGYGYLWWTGEMHGKKVYMAVGYGGQFIFCVPEYNYIISIISNGNVYNATASEQSGKILQIISDYFLPAVK